MRNFLLLLLFLCSTSGASLFTPIESLLQGEHYTTLSYDSSFNLCYTAPIQALKFDFKTMTVLAVIDGVRVASRIHIFENGISFILASNPNDGVRWFFSVVKYGNSIIFQRSDGFYFVTNRTPFTIEELPSWVEEKDF